MDFGELLSRAWKICWNNKYLFVLGFLASLTAGGGGNNSNYQFSGSNGTLPPGFAENMERIMEAALPLFIVLGCVSLFLGLAFWLLTLIAQAGLISSANRLDQGEKVSLGASFSAGLGYLGKMVILNLILYFPVIILVIIGFIALFSTVGMSIFGALSEGAGRTGEVLGSLGLLGACISIMLVCLALPLGLMVTVIYPFAQRGLVLGNLGVSDSIRHGWKVLTQNIGEIVLLAIFFLVLGVGVGFVAGIVLVPLGFLTAAPLVVDMFQGQTPGPLDIVTVLVGVVVLGIVGAAIRSVLTTYRSVAVTLAYQHFVKKTV